LVLTTFSEGVSVLLYNYSLIPYTQSPVPKPSPKSQIPNHQQHTTTDQAYRNRIKAGIIVAQVVLIVAFKFWPTMSSMPEPIEISFDDRRIIAIDESAITTQAAAPPAPPRPFVPVNPILNPVIDITDQLDLRIEPLAILPMEGAGTGASQGTGTGAGGTGEARLSTRPTRPPSVVRIVEPVVPEEVRKARIRAEITVRFLVGVDGLVEEAEIAEIKVYDTKTRQFEKVDDIGYGLREVTLQAAMGWRFRAAEENGEKVRAWSRHLFTFGN
jgi:hypothetical protein